MESREEVNLKGRQRDNRNSLPSPDPPEAPSSERFRNQGLCITTARTLLSLTLCLRNNQRLGRWVALYCTLQSRLKLHISFTRRAARKAQPAAPERRNERTSGTNDRTNAPTNERTHPRTHEKTREQANKRTSKQTNERMHARTRERTNARTSERTNERKNERTNKR